MLHSSTRWVVLNPARCLKLWPCVSMNRYRLKMLELNEFCFVTLTDALKSRVNFAWRVRDQLEVCFKLFATYSNIVLWNNDHPLKNKFKLIAWYNFLLCE
jgi:hypothetical protein